MHDDLNNVNAGVKAAYGYACLSKEEDARSIAWIIGQFIDHLDQAITKLNDLRESTSVATGQEAPSC